MAKHYKTDYFEKMSRLISICCANISIAQKIISSEHSAVKKNTDTGRRIFQEIKKSLEKDFFAPFEREDIFIICEKLNELSESTQFLCIYSKKCDIFSIPSEIKSLIEYLQHITESISAVFTHLSEYPKQGDLTDYFNRTEMLLTDFKKLFFDCSEREKNKSCNTILLLADECAQNCKEITFLIQYTLIKNS